jgi:hypothetical protein
MEQVKWGWKIIKDNIFNPRWDWDKDMKGTVKGDYQGGKHRYRLKDDDGNIYYYIFSDIDVNEGTEGQLFRPLDWAMAYAGCTTIEYKDTETGEYKVL